MPVLLFVEKQLSITSKKKFPFFYIVFIYYYKPKGI
jgi:hypothetical protein